VVAEGATKPDLGLELESMTTTFEVIARLMYATRQPWDDAGQLQKYIPIEAERATTNSVNQNLLTGNGTSPNLLGLVNQPGTLTTQFVPSSAPRAPAEIDCLLDAIAALRVGPAFADAHLILTNPLDWNAIRKVKSLLGTYFLS
jgi:HK97 family phage major capsid protein